MDFATGALLAVAVGAVVASAVYATRTRGRVMDYHQIEAPSVKPMNHGGNGA